MTAWDTPYEARCFQSDGWWAIDIVAENGQEVGYTQVRRLAHAEDMVRDALAALYDSMPSLFTVEVVPMLNERLEQQLERRRRAKERAKDAATAASAQDTRTARALVDAGLTLRDAGIVMGVAHQRVAQLVASEQ